MFLWLVGAILNRKLVVIYRIEVYDRSTHRESWSMIRAFPICWIISSFFLIKSDHFEFEFDFDWNRCVKFHTSNASTMKKKLKPNQNLIFEGCPSITDAQFFVVGLMPFGCEMQHTSIQWNDAISIQFNAELLEKKTWFALKIEITISKREKRESDGENAVLNSHLFLFFHADVHNNVQKCN